MTTSSYLIISKEVENLSLDTIAFLGTHVYWQSSEIVIFLCKYYIVISDTPTGSWTYFYCRFLLFAVILSELHGKPRRKGSDTEKNT